MPKRNNNKQLEKKDNTCPEYARFVHAQRVGNGAIRHFICIEGDMAYMSGDKYATYSLINKQDESIIPLKTHKIIKNKPRNYQISVKSIKISVDGSKTYNAGFDPTKTWLQFYKWHEFNKFIPLKDINNAAKSDKNYSVNMTDFINMKPFAGDFHNLRTGFIDKHKYYIAHVPPNNKKYINLYIYSPKTNKLIHSIENKIVFPDEFHGDLQNFRNPFVDENGCISFWKSMTKFSVDQNYKLKVIKYANNDHYGINSPSKQFTVVQKDKKLIIYSMEDCYDKMYKMNEWELSSDNMNWGRIQWENDHTLIAYNNKYIFIFKNEVQNKLRRQLLFDVFQVEELVDVILTYIGFEFYGCWLCHYIGLYSYKQSKTNKGVVKRINIATYFGKRKNYAFITAYNCAPKTVVVDLDLKHRTQDLVQCIV